MISLTDSAVEAMRSAIAQSAAPVDGLRIMVEAGGCAGLKYMMGLVSERNADDLVTEQDGITILIDPGSEPLLADTTIDFVIALEGSGFTFDNPNAATKCSCGKSFG